MFKSLCGFVNVFYPCLLEASKRLNGARQRSVMAGLAVKEGDLVERNLINLLTDFLVHMGSCKKCMKAVSYEVYRLPKTTDIVSSVEFNLDLNILPYEINLTSRNTHTLLTHSPAVPCLTEAMYCI